MQPNTPFAEFIRLLRQRSPTVLDLLFKEYGRRLFGYALRTWRLSESEAEDVLYETFYVLILKVELLSFASQAHFDGYIYATFSNKLREQFRKKNRNIGQEIPYSSETISHDEREEALLSVSFIEADIAQEYESDVTSVSPLISRMQAALDTLPTADREVLELWSQGYTYEEIGQALHLDPTHLKVKCFRAKQKVITWFNTHNSQ